LALDRGLGAARGRLSDAEREAFDALGLHRALAEARDLLQECFAGLDRISGLVRDLKSFSRLQPERVEWVHPNEVVNQACAIAHNHIRHKARLVKELTALDAFVGDRNKLVQVITNLLVNASQALPEDARDAQVLVRSRAEADRVIISVVDTGPGIPPDVLGRIFEPFYTTKLDTDGTGLGLALSLDIARQHGGTLEVETVQGQGTRFDLVLPRRNGLEVPEAVEAPTRDVRRRGQVWVVDDEPGIRRSLGRLIGRSHDVETFADAAAVLERIDAGGACDVLLCDLMMPEMDGPALYDALLARAPETAGRMVFMSGGAFTERASGFLERVGSQVVDKPAPAAVLEEVIQSALARPEETSEIPG
jgi:CheY-like chemotaxis protein